MTEEQRKTVKVVCNIPNGLELRLFRVGHDDGTGKAPSIPYASYELKGAAGLQVGIGNTDPSQFRSDATPVNEVDKEFMDMWLEQNKMNPMVVQGHIAIVEDLTPAEETDQEPKKPADEIEGSEAAGGDGNRALGDGSPGAGGPEGAGGTGEGGNDDGTLGQGGTNTGHEGGTSGSAKADDGKFLSETGMAGAATPADQVGGNGPQPALVTETIDANGDRKPAIFDDTFSGSIDGYPAGAILSSQIIPGVLYRSTIDGNKNDPDDVAEGWEQIDEEEAAKASTATDQHDDYGKQS